MDLDKAKSNYIYFVGIFLDLFLMILGLSLLVLLAVIMATGIQDIFNIFTNIADFEVVDALNVVDSLLLGLIVLEVFRNISAYLKGLSAVPVAINVGLLAVTRQIVLHRPDNFGSETSYLLVGTTYVVMLGMLLAAYYVTIVAKPREEVQQKTEQVI